MSWNASGASGLGGAWYGSPSFATKTQLISSVTGLESEIQANKGAGPSTLVSSFQTLFVSTLNANYISSGAISTGILVASSINGGGGGAVNINLLSVSTLVGNVLTLSTLNFAPSLSNLQVSPTITLGSNFGQGIGNAVVGGLTSLLPGVFGVIAATAGAGVVLNTGLNALTRPRVGGNINGSVYEEINGTSQLQISTLGNAYPFYSSIYRFVSSTDGGKFAGIGKEYFVSTIFPANTKCIRTAGDPEYLLTAPTSSIQAFSQWVPLLDPDSVLTASTVNANRISSGLIQTNTIQTNFNIFDVAIGNTATIDTISSFNVAVRNLQVSSINNLTISSIVGVPIQSTVVGLGTAGYISSSQLISTVAGLLSGVISTSSNGYQQSFVTSSLVGLGTFGYVSTSQLISSATATGTASSNYTNTVGTATSNFAQSAANIVGFATSNFAAAIGTSNSNYVGTQVQSTVMGLGTVGYVSTSQLISSATATGTASSNYTNTVGTAGSNYTNTVGTATSNYTNTVGTATSNYAGTIGSNTSNYAFNIGTNTSNYAQSYANAIGFATSNFAAAIGTSNSNYVGTQVQSTVIGLGTVGYVSTSQLVSTFIASSNYTNTVGTAGSNYTNTVGTAGSNYTNTVGTATSNYAGTIGTATSNYAGTIGSNTSNYAFNIGTNTSNYAQSYANAIGTSTSNYANSVGTAGSNYTNTVGTATSNYAGTIGSNTSNYAFTIGTNTSNYAQSYANAIGTSTSNYATGIGTATSNYVGLQVQSTVIGLGTVGYVSTSQLISSATATGTASSNYTNTVGTAGSNYTNTVGTAGSNYTNTVGTATSNYATTIGTNTSNYVVSYANSIGAAGSNYTNTVGTATSNYAGTIGSNTSNYVVSYANSVGAAGSNYTNTVGTAGSNYTNTVGTATSNYVVSYANSVGAAGSNYTNTVGTATSNYAGTIGSNTSNYVVSYANSIGAAGSNYATGIGTATSNYAGTIGTNTSNYVGTQVQSTVMGLGTVGYVSTSQLTSTVMGLSGGGGGGAPSNWSLYPALQDVEFAGNALNHTSLVDIVLASTGTPTTFTYTGGDQTYTVPFGVTALQVYMWGGGGEGAYQPPGRSRGGAGAMVQGVMAVTPGQTLTIIVGEGMNIPNRRSYGGGGRSYQADGVWYGAAGGGRSAIQVVSGTDYVVAGGGAGTGFGAQGGAGGLLTGSDGEPAGDNGRGRGGTQTSGGAGGTTAPQSGQAGSLKNGGDASTSSYAGGGGGGYYGGGGGGYGGGGGGSSYTANLTLIPGQTVFGYVSSNQYDAPNTDSPYYQSGVAYGGFAWDTGGGAGSGLVVLVPSSLSSKGGLYGNSLGLVLGSSYSNNTILYAAQGILLNNSNGPITIRNSSSYASGNQISLQANNNKVSIASGRGGISLSETATAGNGSISLYSGANDINLNSGNNINVISSNVITIQNNGNSGLAYPQYPLRIHDASPSNATNNRGIGIESDNNSVFLTSGGIDGLTLLDKEATGTGAGIGLTCLHNGISAQADKGIVLGNVSTNPIEIVNLAPTSGGVNIYDFSPPANGSILLQSASNDISLNSSNGHTYVYSAGFRVNNSSNGIVLRDNSPVGFGGVDISSSNSEINITTQVASGGINLAVTSGAANVKITTFGLNTGLILSNAVTNGSGTFTVDSNSNLYWNGNLVASGTPPVSYANFLLTTFYSPTGGPDRSGPPGTGGNGNDWGSVIQSAQALNPINFGNNNGYYPGGYGNYSAFTSGYVYAATAGTIQFYGITDDGLDIQYNGTAVIPGAYHPQGSTGYTSPVLTLPAGYTPIRIVWYDSGGGGDYRILYSLNGGGFTNDGTGVFYHRVGATY